jgi:hypothetical protein
VLVRLPKLRVVGSSPIVRSSAQASVMTTGVPSFT